MSAARSPRAAPRKRRGGTAGVALARDVLDALHEGCQVVSPAWRYLYVNDVVVEQARASREALLGRTMMECFPGIDRTPMFETLRRVMSERTHAQMENEFAFPDGSRGWFQLRFVPVPAGVCILSIDVTDYRRAIAALEESEASFRELFEASPDATLLAREDGAIELANAAAGRVFRMPPHALCAMQLEDLIPGWAAMARPTPGAAEAPHATGTLRDLRARRPDGTQFPAGVSLGPAGHRGARTWLAVVRDMSEHEALERSLRRAEEQTRQMQKMEAVSRLAGAIAHDFNNMLSVVLSYCSLIRSSSELTESVGADVEQIRTAAARAADLTAQLLSFSRQRPFAPRVTVLDDQVRPLEPMLRTLLGATVALRLRLDSTPALVMVDRGQIEQVVMNLVVNARDATPGGGWVTIETEVVELGEAYAREHLGTRPGPHVMLAVSDNGSGMDAATQARIFEPFYTTKPEGRGTGLGLSTVFGIVQQAGGSIWVYSEPGVGTTFKLYFPVAAPLPVETSTAPTAIERLGGSERILLVEDDAQLRALMSMVLRRAGYDVWVTASGAEALALSDARAVPIDLLVTDVVLGATNGVELARTLRRAQPDLRVLFVSGYTGTALTEHELIEDGVDLLEKPITPETLLPRVRRALGPRTTGPDDGD